MLLAGWFFVRWERQPCVATYMFWKGAGAIVMHAVASGAVIRVLVHCPLSGCVYVPVCWYPLFLRVFHRSFLLSGVKFCSNCGGKLA